MSKAILATNSSMTRSRDLSPLRQNLNRHLHWPYTKKLYYSAIIQKKSSQKPGNVAKIGSLLLHAEKTHKNF